MPCASRLTVTRAPRPGTAISPSVWGNDRLTTTTAVTSAATTASTSSTTTYVVQRAARDQDLNGGRRAAVSGTAHIVPAAGTPPRWTLGTCGESGISLAVRLRECQLAGPCICFRTCGGPVPTYQYACTDCGYAFDKVQSFSDDSLTVCPECDGRLRKVFNAVGVVFKGFGFYRTDSRSDARSATSSDSSSSASGASGSGGSGSEGSKPSAKDKKKDSKPAAASSSSSKSDSAAWPVALSRGGWRTVEWGPPHRRVGAAAPSSGGCGTVEW